MKLEAHLDYYLNEAGYMVLTAHYLRKRGYCCGNGCLHCPYDYEKVPEPRRSILLQQRLSGRKEAEDGKT